MKYQNLKTFSKSRNCLRCISNKFQSYFLQLSCVHMINFCTIDVNYECSHRKTTQGKEDSITPPFVEDYCNIITYLRWISKTLPHSDWFVFIGLMDVSRTITLQIWIIVHCSFDLQVQGPRLYGCSGFFSTHAFQSCWHHHSHFFDNKITFSEIFLIHSRLSHLGSTCPADNF